MTDDDLRARLDDAGTSLVADVAFDPSEIAARARRSHHRRRTARIGVVAALAVAGSALGVSRVVGSDDPGVETSAADAKAGAWERVPDAPLTPRTGATAAWNGHEVVVVGGWDFLCPPTADCAGPAEPAFTDGAAYDPATRRWRAIAPSPVPLHGEAAVTIGEDVYLLAQAASGGVSFLRYAPAADDWTVLDPPPTGRDHDLVSAGPFVVAYTGSDEGGEVPDLLFDTRSSTWTEIPDDPLPATFDRTIVTRDDGASLILIAAAIGGSTEPSEEMNLAARLEVAAGTWEELPRSPGRGYRGWGVDDVVVLEPHFGGSGGSLDPGTGRWTELPGGPAQEGWQNEIAGVVGRADAVYASSGGWVLDLARSRWIRLDPPDDRLTYPESNVTAMGRDLFLYGGERWGSGDGELLGDAWIWRAPRADAPPDPTTTAPAPSGRLTIELIDPPGYIEGYDLAVRVTPDGGDAIERGLDDFVTEAGERPGFMESSSLTLDVPSGVVAVQAHLTIGPGGGPAEPDFDDDGDGSLCTPVTLRVPAGGGATVRMDWDTGCLESDDALSPAESELLPTRPPDASGVLIGPYPDEADRRWRLAVSAGQPPSYDYSYLDASDAVIVSGVDGRRLAPDDITRGTRVEVWITGCDDAETPTCEVEAVRTRR